MDAVTPGERRIIKCSSLFVMNREKSDDATWLHSRVLSSRGEICLRGFKLYYKEGTDLNGVYSSVVQPHAPCHCTAGQTYQAFPKTRYVVPFHIGWGGEAKA